jgi:hypothetical protein
MPAGRPIPTWAATDIDAEAGVAGGGDRGEENILRIAQAKSYHAGPYCVRRQAYRPRTSAGLMALITSKNELLKRSRCRISPAD